MTWCNSYNFTFYYILCTCTDPSNKMIEAVHLGSTSWRSQDSSGRQCTWRRRFWRNADCNSEPPWPHRSWLISQHVNGNSDAVRKYGLLTVFPTLQHSISLFAFSNHNSIYRNKWSFSWLPNQLVPPTFLSRCFVTYPPSLAKVLVPWLDVAPPAKMRIQVHRIHDLNFWTHFNVSD